MSGAQRHDRSVGATRRTWVGLLCAICAGLTACTPGPIDAVSLDPNQLHQGLIAYWSFDDGIGTTLTDQTAHHYNGTLLSGATWINDHAGFGGALHFDGSDQSEVSVPAFPQPTGSWSVAGWIRAQSGDTMDSYATIISTELLRAGGWEMNLQLSPPGSTNVNNAMSLYQFAYWTGPGDSDYGFEDCLCFVANEWTHIAGVVDTDLATISIYQGGMLVAKKPITQDIIPGSDTLYFGRWANDGLRRLTGDLDDFVIYNRTLAQAEIQILAREPLPSAP